MKMEKARMNFLVTEEVKYKILKTAAKNSWSVLKPISRQERSR
jgi:hypothetical protein